MTVWDTCGTCLAKRVESTCHLCGGAVKWNDCPHYQLPRACAGHGLEEISEFLKHLESG